MEILKLVFSFLGGGLVSGLITYWGTTRSERRKRRIENLKAELQDLYGPIRFLSLWNERLFSLSSSILNAYRAEYEGKEWSEEKSTQDVTTQVCKEGSGFFENSR